MCLVCDTVYGLLRKARRGPYAQSKKEALNTASHIPIPFLQDKLIK